jgi:acetate kinase
VDTLAYLRAHPLFEGCSEESLSELAAKTETVSFGPGEILLRAGAPGVLFGILRSGRAEAVTGYGTPERRHLGYVEPDECFGEISLMTGESTSADVVALAAAEALLLPEESFTKLIAGNRKSIRYLSRLIAKRLRGKEQAAERAVARPAFSLGASGPMRLLVVNCGSSSLKCNYYDTSSESPAARALVERLNTPEARMVYEGPKGRHEEQAAGADHERAFRAVAAALTHAARGVLPNLKELSVIGHRVVHGGPDLDAPVMITKQVKQTIRDLAALAPLHNPLNLLGIELCARRSAGRGLRHRLPSEDAARRSSLRPAQGTGGEGPRPPVRLPRDVA